MAEVRSTRTRRPVTQPDEESAEETLYVTATYGGKEKTRNERLSVKKFLSEPAYVRVAAGMTRNMGNYESLRLDVGITMPCYPEEVDKAFVVVADKVAKFLDEELKEYE